MSAGAGVYLTDLSTLLVLFHLAGNHWTLVYLNVHGRSVVYYDSSKALENYCPQVMLYGRRWL